MRPKVYIRKARGFGEVFGDTIAYIKQNFRSLFGSILLLVSPFVLLATILITYLFKTAFAGIGLLDPYSTYTNVGLITLLMIFMYLIGYSAFITVLNEHMILNDTKEANERVQISDVVKNFFSTFLRGLGSLFILLILTFVIAIVIGLVFAAFAFVIKMNAFFGILMFFLLYIFMLLVVTPMAMYYFSAILFTTQRHKISVFAAIGKVRRNMKENFWITWSISFLGGMITNFLTFIAFIPSYIILVITMLTRANRAMNGSVASDMDMPLYLVVLFCITGILIVCICSIYFVMMNMHCASLEEKKEGLSIMEKIESI